MAASTELGAASAPGAVGPPEPVAVTSGWDRHLRLPRSPKIIFGCSAQSVSRHADARSIRDPLTLRF